LENTKPVLITGLIVAALNVVLFFVVLFINSALALKILSMIGACLAGGRLPFIGVGFELGLSAVVIILIIIFYNSAYVLLVYSLFVILSQKVKKYKFIQSIKKKVQYSKNFRSNWNLVSIAIFIWIPLPMTGAAIGAIIAYLEGYKNHQIIITAMISMYIGVISWTLAFDRMYDFLQSINWLTAFGFTVFLLITPIIYNLMRNRQRSTK
jgi:uncharacterized membrane protein